MSAVKQAKASKPCADTETLLVASMMIGQVTDPPGGVEK